MKRLLKRIVLSSLCFMTFAGLGLVNVEAYNIEPRAIETLTLKKTYDLGQYGHIIWYADLSYNATTQKSTLKAIRHTDYFSKSYPFAMVTSISHSPAIGGAVTPSSTSGVTINFSVCPVLGLSKSYKVKLTTSTS